MDSVLIADFAKNIKNGATVLDLGTGTGIIATLLCAKSNLGKIFGVEIQEAVAEMAMRSVRLNGLQNKFEILNHDIRALHNVFEPQSIDTIVTNPPYKKENSGGLNENEIKLISRHEVKCSLEDIIKQSNYLLKDKGTFYMVHRPERLTDILYYCRKHKLEPKDLRFVHSKGESDAKLLLVKCVKNANPFLKIHPPLIVYNADGTYTDEIFKIYGGK